MHPLEVRKDKPVAQFEIGSYKNFVYLILDWAKKKAAIVDPQEVLDPLLDCFREHQFELDKVLLTHTHFDHIAGVPGLIKLYPRVPILVHSEDAHRLKGEWGRVETVSDGETIQVGTLGVTVLHTPGHSAGECSYLLDEDPPYLFTGDTVFIRDCGRTDLPTGSNEQMYHSLQRIKTLPGNTIILPGHHYKPEYFSMLDREMRESPPFLCKSIEELASLP